MLYSTVIYTLEYKDIPYIVIVTFGVQFYLQ